MDSSRPLLGIVDYMIFGLMLTLSSGIGVYFRFSGGKQKTTEEYLLAGKDMSILPVAFSLMASFLSAITVIGIPAEMYRYGIHLAYLNIGYSLGMVITAFLTLPVYFELQASTAYEYLDRRFGKFARTLTSTAFVFQMILYMSVVLYAPAVALSAVTNMSIWVAVISIGVVCTFYCTLGGMKAVLWTDVLQALLMFIGLFAVLFKGVIDMGVTQVYRRAYDGGRLAFPGFSLDPTERYTMWNVLMQGTTLSMIAYGGNQVQVQRMLTVKNISKARMALYVSIPLGVAFHLLNCLVGIVIYAHYAHCDPLTSPDAPLTSADQLLPYYTMSTLGEYPGLPGLCICSVFSASLSSISSAVNSLTAVTMQDLVKPFLVTRGISQDKMTFTAKAITFFYGFLCVSLTYVVASFGNLIQSSLTIFGMLGGPVLSVFILGMMTTKANEKGAVIGLLGGIAISAWISFGSNYVPQWLPVSTDGCVTNQTDFNSSSLITHLSISSDDTFILEQDDIFPLYKISYMWFSGIGIFSTISLGYLASIVINLIQGETAEVPLELLTPMVKYFMKTEKEIKNTDNLELKTKTELPMTKGVSQVQTQNGAPDAQKAENQNSDSTERLETN